jgi:hypothetical protein
MSLWLHTAAGQKFGGSQATCRWPPQPFTRETGALRPHSLCWARPRLGSSQLKRAVNQLKPAERLCASARLACEGACGVRRQWGRRGRYASPCGCAAALRHCRPRARFSATGGPTQRNIAQCRRAKRGSGGCAIAVLRGGSRGQAMRLRRYYPFLGFASEYRPALKSESLNSPWAPGVRFESECAALCVSVRPA